MKNVLFVVIVLLLAMGPAASDPIVIAHRGASGYLPEHTLEAYAMAYAMGADYVEQDIVLTKDSHFVCLHDIYLEPTTDVEERFPDRKRADGRWYAADFTLAEIKTLNAHERLPNRFPVGGAPHFEVPTFEEAIELVQGLNKTTGRDIGIYPELKAPTWHIAQKLPMEKAFLDIVERYGYKGPDAKIFVQCFEPMTLQKLRNDMGCTLPMILLISDDKVEEYLLTEEGLDKIATFATGIGPDKKSVEENPKVVEWAHARKLLVHPYTLRKDQCPKKYAAFQDEIKQFYTVYKVDGMFTDFTDECVKYLAANKAN
ncbi:MAG TPA: glycerophosphodiester phosphodiesterase [Candidatus Hydrogenedentes bacterium]|nr:glycerophosphodiester phosphodiesterase [Candidatus Hydrogenedentota bacterium]